jgi:hypothetical protein
MVATRTPAPLRIVRDQVYRSHYYLEDSSSAAVSRFEALRRDLVALRLMPIDDAALPLACLILLEVVVDLEQLRPAYSALAEIRQWRDRPFLDWRYGSGMVARRYVSVYTVEALMRHREPLDLPVAQARLRDRLVEAHVSLPSLSPAECIAALLADAAAWAAVHLPGHLVGQVTGTAPLACVPRSTLARECSRQALFCETSGNETDAMQAIAELLDAGEDGDVHRASGRIEHALDAAFFGLAGLTEAARRREASARLHERALALAPLSSAEALVVASAIYIVQIGTPHTQPLRCATSIDYVIRVAPGLLRELPALLGLLDDAAAWREAYARIVDDVEPGSRHKAGAALTAFHCFVSTIGRAPHLAGPAVRGVVIEPPPRANRVWPHECHLINAWLDVAGATRLLHQARALFSAIEATGARTGDALTLLVDGVRVSAGDGLVLSFDPLQTAKRSKTLNARRQVQVSDRDAAQRILAWRMRRIQEGAGGRDLLFGDAYAPRRIWREWATLSLLWALLKQATGDPLLSLHSLRHERICRDLELIPAGIAAERRVAQLSADYGHETPQVTHRHYNHVHDLQLGSVLDDLESEITVPEAAAAQWLRTRAGTLRKRWSRQRTTPREFVRAALAEQRRRAPVPDVRDDFVCVPPRASALAIEVRRPGYCDVTRVLSDGCDGRAVQSIALRGDLSELWVRTVLLSAAACAGVRIADDDLDGPLELLCTEMLLRCKPPIALSALSQPKIRTIVHYLDRQAFLGAGAERLRAACAAWRACLSGRYVSLHDAKAALPLLRLLAAAGVSAGDLVVRVADRGAVARDTDRRIRQARERFVAAFGAEPVVDYCARRRGRPRIYLLLGGGGRTSRELSGSGLHAAMYCLSVWLSTVDTHQTT